MGGVDGIKDNYLKDTISQKEIKYYDVNLNIPRYVDIFEVEMSIYTVRQGVCELENESAGMEQKMVEVFKEVVGWISINSIN